MFIYMMKFNNYYPDLNIHISGQVIKMYNLIYEIRIIKRKKYIHFLTQLNSLA